MRLTLVFSIAGLFVWAAAHAEEPALVLKQDTELRGSAAAGDAGPLFISADRIESISTNVIEASGKVAARKAGQNFFADTFRYDTSLEQVEAEGNIRLEQANLILTGNTLKLKLDTNTGTLTEPSYRILPQQSSSISGRGEAKLLELLGDDRFSAKDATYTTCPVGNDDWKLKVDDLQIDQVKQVGTARNVLLTFKSMPLLYSPWADFTLNNERKSGFLAPTVGFTSKSGLDLTLPYYFNIAPNYDATLYPRYLARRGIQLGGEFRYLMPSLRGEIGLEYLPDDQTEDRSRWLASIQHTQDFSQNLKGQVSFQRVSDDEYFRDLSNQVEVTSRSILPQDGLLTYDGDWWQAALRVQQLQVLQDPKKPILQTPYYRLPQFTLAASRSLLKNLKIEFDGEYSQFHHPDPDPLTQAGGGNRFRLYPRVMLPFSNSAFFITPKIGLNYTSYEIDKPLPGTSSNQDRLLPVASLDTGFSMERAFKLNGDSYLQTLEPRAFYVYAPYRDQSDQPVFDTALLDLSFAQLFSENQFIGGDRFNDANQLTLALTSRFIEQDSGLERLKVAFGQRYYFASQKVTLPGDSPVDSKTTDLLVLLSGQVTKSWHVDTTWQYDTDFRKTVRSNITTSYRPQPGKAASLGYRFIDGSAEQVDAGLQWPVTSRLYGLLRANYSLRDNSLAEGLAGVEYNGGCWILRAVAQRIATAEKDSSNSFYLQLELKGMGRLGASPLNALKKGIPGYTPTNEFQIP